MKKQLVSAVAALMLAAISTPAVAATEWVIIEKPNYRPQGQYCETPYEKYYIDGRWRPIGDRCRVHDNRGRITR